MGAKIFDSEKSITKMFTGETGLTEEQELALHILHKFNIDRETLEEMPAFDEHVKPLFSKSIEK